MRVALFVPQFPAVSETFVLRQITGLLDLGHEVDIYARAPDATGAPVHGDVLSYGLLRRTRYLDRANPPAAGYWEMPVWPLTGETWLPGAARAVPNARRALRAVPVLLRCLARDPALTRHVLRRSEFGDRAASLGTLYDLRSLGARTRRYDVVHAHFGPTGDAIRFVRRLWSAPLVVSFHGYDCCTVPRRKGRDVYDGLFRDADAVVVNSEYTRGRIADLGCPPEKIRKIPVGLDVRGTPFRERRLRPGEAVRLLTVARLVEIKGVEYALRAVARVVRGRPDLRYDVVGDGPLRPRLESLAASLGLGPTVTFHGARDGAFVREAMGAAHLLVHASVTVEGDAEGQGLVLQEAQASGLPVVATRHGAFPEGLLPGVSGVLVPERDEAALAEAIETSIACARTWPEMGRAGRAFVERAYDVARLNRDLVRLYAELRRFPARERRPAPNRA